MNAAPSTRRRARRDEILDAACRVIARVGTRALRVEDVAGEAGVATSLLYYYFDDRTALLTAAFRHANSQLVEVRDDPTATGRERLTRHLLAELADDPATAENWSLWSEMMAAAVFDASLREPINEAYAAWIGRVSELIEIGRADGTIGVGADPRRTAERLCSLMDGLGSRTIMGGVDRDRARSITLSALEIELA
jgi:AcrR family transcriptional regulator